MDGIDSPTENSYSYHMNNELKSQR